MSGTVSSGAPALCINCGFVGASYMVGMLGPYCAECARKAGGLSFVDGLEVSDDPITNELADIVGECEILKHQLVIARRRIQELEAALGAKEKSHA